MCLLQDAGHGAISELLTKEDYEEILNRKIEQMKKKNEELLQKHLVCGVVLSLDLQLNYAEVR